MILCASDGNYVRFLIVEENRCNERYVFTNLSLNFVDTFIFHVCSGLML